MLVSDFDYELPPELIAQEPAADRDQSRLLVVDRRAGDFVDAKFEDLPGFLRSGDLLVVNNTRVFPARLTGTRMKTDRSGEETAGRRVEVFLIRQIEPFVWEALVRPGKALLPGAEVEFDPGLKAEVIEWFERGRRLVRFQTQGDLEELIDRIGQTPLPPYIKRPEPNRLDADRYQTVFARHRGSIAAPTAGLHFTKNLLDRLAGIGVESVEITLHVGYGTFQPVRVERVEEHHVEPESYEIEPATAEQINLALKEGRRVIAVGTTSTRALESAASKAVEPGSPPIVLPGRTSSELFIHPGYDFKILGGLVTNFHLPRSSLLMLVSAFAGRERILAAYHHAVKNRYRFYSYGDAMLIL